MAINQLQYASPVTSLLQGQQAAQQQQGNELAMQMQRQQMGQQQQAMQRDGQFRNALQAYLTGGTNSLASLYSADPERAMQVQTFQTQQNQLATQQRAAEAKQSYAQAQGVIHSESPADYLRVLIPKAAAAWSEKSGKPVEEMTDEDALALANQVATVAGSMAGIVPEYTSPEAGQVDGKDVFFQTEKNSGKPRVLPGVSPKKPDAPNSYDEFIQAQKDPAFAKFLKERKGKGLSVTTPDGTVIEIGGEGGGVGAGELSKPTINNLQEAIVNSTNRLDRLNATLTTYNPEFLRAKGMANATATRVQDFLGLSVSDDQRKFLSEYSEFQANSAQDFNQLLKELSGVAVNASELARAEKAAPSAKDISPIEFEAKAKATTKFATRAIMRANWALKNGIGVKSVEQLAKVMPLEGIDQVYEQRANEIWKELGETAETKRQAVEQAKQEFGIAR